MFYNFYFKKYEMNLEELNKYEELWYIKMLVAIKKHLFGYCLAHNVTHFIDEIFEIYDENNETVMKCEQSKEKAKETIKKIKENQEDIDNYLKNLIEILLYFGYAIR